MKAIDNTWDFAFLIPNINLKEQIGNENIAIVPKADPRAKLIIKSKISAKAFVSNFKNQFGKKISPTLLLIQHSRFDNFTKEVAPIVGFRNIIAISCIIKSYQDALNNNHTVGGIFYSDNFNIYPFSIRGTDDDLVRYSPSIMGMDYEYAKFRGQTTPGLTDPDDISLKPDVQLFQLLEKAWNRHYIKNNNKWQMIALFRSLEMAYQALHMPFGNYKSIYDFGLSASLWVSAFEILSHPQKANVNLKSVIDLLEKYIWIDKKAKRKTYNIKIQGHPQKVNISQKLYKELYDARNDFLHGNPVRINRLYPFKNKKLTALTKLAPLIYKVVLLVFLNNLKNKPREIDPNMVYLEKMLQEEPLAKALLKAKKGN